MSEASNTKLTNFLTSRQFIFVLLGVFVVLILLYLGGFSILPTPIMMEYQNRNCQAVINLGSIYTKFYPSHLIEENTSNAVQECAIYTLARKEEADKSWQDSNNAFLVYSLTYPAGLFVDEVHEHNGVVLTGLAGDEIDQKMFSEAEINLKIVLEKYGDTTAAAGAKTQMLQLYQTWGSDLRASGNFADSIKIFTRLKSWANSINDSQDARNAQLEIAKTNLTWALVLQSSEQFEEAKSKLDEVINSDPNPSDDYGPAAQAKAGLVELYNQWGDYLIKGEDFAGAINRYKTAISLNGTNSSTNSTDKIASGYQKWAIDMSNKEEFISALNQIELAKQNAASDEIKKLINVTQAKIITDFSNSDGDQAQKAMADAKIIVCEQHTQPDLPIFGLDNQKILLGIYGVDADLPDSVAANTPGSLHYIACVEEVSKKIGSQQYPVASGVFNSSAGPGTVVVTYYRIRYDWKVMLRDIKTGDEYLDTTIFGGAPPSLSIDQIDLNTINYYGSKPDVSDLVKWYQSVLQ